MPDDKEPHGNSKKSKKEQHLYEIVDSQTNETVKYGISGSKLNKDGSSKRANFQVRCLNKLKKAVKYFANVLFTKIANRNQALELEQKIVNKYAKENKNNPPRDQKRPKIQDDYET